MVTRLTSIIGKLRLMKYSETSLAIGAAPLSTIHARSSPNALRTLVKTSALASANPNGFESSLLNICKIKVKYDASDSWKQISINYFELTLACGDDCTPVLCLWTNWR